MQQRKQHTAFAVDGYAITASFADCKNAAALHHVKQILLSSAICKPPFCGMKKSQSADWPGGSDLPSWCYI